MKKAYFLTLVLGLFLLPLHAVNTSQLLADKGYFPTGDNPAVAPSEIDDESDDNPNNSCQNSHRETLLNKSKNSKDPKDPKEQKGYFPEE